LNPYLNLSLVLLAPWLCCGALAESYEQAPISYSKTPANDAISALQKKIDEGSKALLWNEQGGYLRGLLQALNIPESSQVLVFSKTSFQRQKIWPSAPRALYFNDDVYIGAVKGGDVLEISAADPRQGAMFYTLDQRADPKPKFQRQTHNCLQCHDSMGLTGGVPGHIVRSVFPDGEGMPMLNLGTFRTNYQSPLSERWGGWYTTGQHGTQRHMGNLVFPNAPDLKILGEVGANRTDLSEHFDSNAYLSGASDIVALMVLEYQTYAHNSLTRCSYEVRTALLQNKEINRALERPETHVSESTTTRIMSVCDYVIETLLLKDEAKLTDAVKGNTTFAADFSARGIRDEKGRSLRDFDLTKRMFKHACSYMIYTESFDSLPPEALRYIYQRLWDILNGRDSSKNFDYISADDRKASLEILRETKKNLPEYWKAPR